MFTVSVRTLFSQVVLAESGPRGQQVARTGAVTNDFDAHDLSGIWLMRRDQANAVNSIGRNVPPMTPEGMAEFSEHIPTGSNPDRPSLSNDPAHTCNPFGFPRILIGLNPEPIEFINSDEKADTSLSVGTSDALSLAGRARTAFR